MNNYIGPAELAAKCINQTHKSVFLTGKAGTGKTTFLRSIIEHTHKNAIIVAPTGIAAINAGGVTIHSQFQLPFGMYVPNNDVFGSNNNQLKINTPYSIVKNMQMSESKRALLREVELLIIDEVSMLRADLLDGIDMILRYVRRQNSKPFGGVQILFIGDLMQLPPVVKEEEWNVLRNYYNSIYFFDAHALRHEKPVYIELDKIYRQSDSTFIDLLNNLRNNKVSQEDIDLLNSFYTPNFEVNPKLNIITLTTHNQKADMLNRSALNKLKDRSYFFKAKTEGIFNENAYPVESVMELKLGAQVMFIKNDPSGKQQFFNGKIGVISSLNEKDEIEVDFRDGTKTMVLEKYEWKNIQYELNQATNEIEEKEIGTFTQYPIKLAWAITIHKSQGLTFEKAILDINDAFAPGQVYVALSRLKSLQGLVLTSPIQFNVISQDKTLVSYADNKPQTDEVNDLIQKETAFFLKSFVLSTYNFSWLYTCFKKHIESYSMSENKSNKQKHQTWAQELFEKFEPVKSNVDKFNNQLVRIFESACEDYLHILQSRHIAAKNYFYPVFKDISKSILVHIGLLKDEKQIKTYLEELLELEGLIYKHIQQFGKLSVLLDNIINNKEFNKQQLQDKENQQERFELAKQAINLTEKKSFEDRKTKKITKSSTSSKQKEEKVLSPKKPNTKELSFVLFKEGKNVSEIAEERGFSIGTIEGHLAHYVSLGMIPVTEFVAKEKFEIIIDILSKVNGDNVLAAVKQVLGDNYSYSEIKFSLATQKHTRKA